MKKISALIFLSGIMLFTFSDVNAQKNIPKEKQLIIYGEIYGHNYYGCESLSGTGIISLNLGIRKQLKNPWSFILASVGWGIFKEKHLALNAMQPNWVNYVPVEITFQLGREGNASHFFEAGLGVAAGFGKQILYFVYSADHVGYRRMIEIKNGIQYIPRLGWAFYGKDVQIRIGITPHFGTGIDTTRPKWIPLGLSTGFCF